MNPLNNFKTERYRETVSKLIVKWWFLIHIIFIAAYALFLIYKIKRGGYVFREKVLDIKIGFTPEWFILNIAGFAILTYVFLYEKIRSKMWLYLSLITVGFFLIVFSFIKTVDPDLIWDNSDVTIGNYISARESKEYGAADLLKTWNDRANPYDSSEVNSDIKDSIRKFVAHYNLTGLTFGKWKTKLDTTKYNLDLNNRAYVHSPLPTLLMGWWMSIFPFDRWSLEMFMFALTLFSILIVVYYSYKRNPGNFSAIVLIALITSPVMIRYPHPSTDQMSMFLFTVPVFLFLINPSKKFSVSFLYGLIYGICFFSKFTVFVHITIFTLFLFLYRKQISYMPLLGLFAGILIPVIIFTSAGYYMWLTFITGRIITKMFAMNNPVIFTENLTKLLYFGPSFILMTIFLMVNSNKLKKDSYTYYYPFIISFIILIIYLYDQGAWNRYMTQYMPGISLFLLASEKTIELRKRDLFIAIFTNFVFLNLNTYF